MGVVFACRHLGLNKDYALKLLPGGKVSAGAWQRLTVEASALARLNHSHIVGIHNMGIHAEQSPYYVMDLLSGETLEDCLRASGPLDIDLAIKLFIRVADALNQAHQQGIVHRDIKPSNFAVIRDPGDQITGLKIIDFGIARLSDPEGGKARLAGQGLTATGAVFGTPYYMSPEQCRGERVDARADIYSFGCTLYETLVGRPPFKGATAIDTFSLHMSEPPPALSDMIEIEDAGDQSQTEDPEREARSALVEGLQAILLKALAKNPNERYQAMSQVKLDLERIKSGKPPLVAGALFAPASFGRASAEPVDDLSVDTGEHDYATVPPGDKIATLLSPGRLLALACTAMVALVVAMCFMLYRPGKPSVSTQNTMSSHVYVARSHSRASTDSGQLDRQMLIDSAMPESANLGQLLGMEGSITQTGADKDDVKRLNAFDLLSIKNHENAFKREMDTICQPAWFEKPFYVPAKKAFVFPETVIFGAISINGAKPVQAVGTIKKPQNADVTFYWPFCNHRWGLLNKFKSDDLTGLDGCFLEPDKVVGLVSKWTRLRELSFFNPLIKAMPNYEKHYDESMVTPDVLPLLEKLPHLQVLGLCGALSSDDVLSMPLLHRLKGLRLKRLMHYQDFLPHLVQYPNLQELWLVGSPVTDEQLDNLIAMPNLQRLKILRSKLTPASAAKFKAMKHLKELTIDRNNWTEEQKAYFKSVIPFVKYEKVVDTDYWVAVPAKYLKPKD